MTKQTNLYAVQHGKGNLNILKDEIRTFIALLLLSGYCKAPYPDLYWADAPDTHKEAASCVISGNRFRKILSNLHLADSTQVTENWYYRVRVLFEKLSFDFKHYGSFVNRSVDERITPYCGVEFHLPDTGLGQGADIVLGLIEKCKVKGGSTVTFDNLFTSPPLSDELAEFGIGTLGTLRQIRFHGTPAANKTH